MGGKSKRERVDSFIRRAVRQAIQEIYWQQARNGAEPTLRSVANDLGITAAFNISGDPYRMRELADIMAWKKPPKEI